jgi:hypothetical protein
VEVKLKKAQKLKKLLEILISALHRNMYSTAEKRINSELCNCENV